MILKVEWENHGYIGKEKIPATFMSMMCLNLGCNIISQDLLKREAFIVAPNNLKELEIVVQTKEHGLQKLKYDIQNDSTTIKR